MAQYQRMSKFFLIAAALCLPTLISATLSAQTRILVCESSKDSCDQPDASMNIVWLLNGTEGTATSPGNPAGSPITIEKFDGDSLVVRRLEQAGPTAGLTAVYTGAVHGAHVSGTVDYSWPGHPDYPAHGMFAAVLPDQLAPAAAPVAASDAVPDSLPTELLVCENHGACNAAWVLHGSEGTGTWFAQKPVRATLAIINSAHDNIRIHRADTSDGVAANYVGSLRGDHYAGTIIWSGGDHPGEKTGSWTATIPQTSCPNHGLEPEDAMRIGQTALMFHHDREALDCYVVAASAGDATAQTVVGLTYYQGRPSVPQDYAQALFWLQKAADQGVYNAQKTVAEMYLAGQGTRPNPTMAQIYKARADEQKRDFERAQDRQFEARQRAADRATQVLSSFVLGASFGMFW
jgi:hypothetical protein